MLRRFRSRLTYANLMSTIAVVVAVGTGSAYAANTVFSSDIVDGEVKSVDIGNNEIGSADVKDNTINTFDVHSFLGVDVVDDTLTGNDVDESTLAGLDATDGYDLSCDPDGETFLDCDASATVTLGRPMDVLVTAMTHFRGISPGAVGGHCRLERNDVAVSNDHLIGEQLDNTFLPAAAGMQVTDVESLSAGTYTFEVSCNQVTTGDIRFDDIRVSVVELAMD